MVLGSPTKPDIFIELSFKRVYLPLVLNEVVKAETLLKGS